MPTTIEEKLTALAQKEHFMGAICVQHHSKPVLEQVFGYANLDFEIYNSLHTLFNVGSVGKCLTAIAILQLAEKNLLNLHQSIQNYLPAHFKLSEALQQLTPHQLLSHTSGLGNYMQHPNYKQVIKNKLFTHTELFEYVNAEQLAFEPSTNFLYSNSGFIVLGCIIENISNCNYNSYIKKNILDRANMSCSGIFFRHNIVKNRAVNYHFLTNNNAWQNVTNEEPTPFADGGLLSNVPDLQFFFNALKNNDLLSPAFQNLLFQKHAPTQRYGYGWFLDERENHLVAYHTGSAVGVNSHIRYALNGSYNVIILSNGTTPKTMQLIFNELKINNLLL